MFTAEKVQFILPHGDYVFQGDTGVPIGHFAPYRTETTRSTGGYESAAGAGDRLRWDLTTAQMNADFHPERGKDVRAGTRRTVGRDLYPLAELVCSIYYGFDYYEKLILAALGEDVVFPQVRRRSPNASMLLRSDSDGAITPFHK